MRSTCLESDDQGAGTSVRLGSCVETWPPLTVKGDTSATGAVATEVDSFEREEGETQATANVRLLYYYSNDLRPGDTEGQGVNDT